MTRAKLHDLRQRQRAQAPEIEAKLRSSQPEPVRTSAEIRDLIATAKAEGRSSFQLRVHRFKPVRRGATIRLPVLIDDVVRWGPMSSEDATIVSSGGHNYTTSWRVADVERWLLALERRR